MLDDVQIDTALVRRLLRAQFPGWSELPLQPIEPGGWDNRTFRLGDALLVRMPSAAGYAPQVEKEQRWLPVLAPLLPLAIPIPAAVGQPGEGYPWQWSVLRWLEGEDANSARGTDRCGIATALAGFIRALQRIDPSGGPSPGAHNCQRGGPLLTYDEQTRRAIACLGSSIDEQAARELWEAALIATDDNHRLWLHGDLSAGNLLLNQGRLSAVIDFGCCAVGDPACDLAIAWTYFDRATRDRFRAELAIDEKSWTRGRGWALWKALIVTAGLEGTDPSQVEGAQATLREVLTDHARRG